jgi:uncharacterized protein
MIEAVLAGFVLGLVSSFHCVGMCGPLALSLPVKHLPPAGRTWAVLLYNLGRILTYASLGLILGLTGRRLYIAGFQQGLSIACGTLVLIFVLQYFWIRKPWHPSWLTHFNSGVQHLMGLALRSRNLAGFLLLGMANGLLPCGMVYLALAGALGTANPSNSTLFMVFFGAGTLPAMMLMGLAGIRMGFPLRNLVKKASPYLAFLMAVLLILRGLSLGIPMISPILAHQPGTALSCPR